MNETSNTFGDVNGNTEDYGVLINPYFTGIGQIP